MLAIRTTATTFDSDQLPRTSGKCQISSAVSTALRMQRGFGSLGSRGLKWCDIDFDLEAINVTRSVAYGVVGRAKLNRHRSRYPLIHFFLRHSRPGDYSSHTENQMIGFCEQTSPRSETDLGPSDSAQIHSTKRKSSGSRNTSDGILFATPTRLFYGALERSLRSYRNYFGILRCDRPLMFIRRQSLPRSRQLRML
jgi:hypothetical protein